MQMKPKRKLKNIDFSEDTSHIALVSKNQGGPANGANYSLVLKNADNASPEFIQKMQQIQVTYELPDFLRKVMGLYYEDAELLARMLGYVQPENEQKDYDDWYENYIEEKLQAFTIIKSLHEAKSLPEALSKLTEQDYLDVLADQVEVEKVFKELDKESKDSEADNSTKVESKVEGSPSKQVKKNKGKQMTQATEQVEKSKFVEVEKALEGKQVELQKALEKIAQFEEAQKQAVIKSKTDAVKAVLKDEKQAAVVLKAVLALETQEDVDALVAVFKAQNELIEKSALFVEQGAGGSADDSKESSLAKLVKSKYPSAK